jgi:hypothetical protein
MAGLGADERRQAGAHKSKDGSPEALTGINKQPESQEWDRRRQSMIDLVGRSEWIQDKPTSRLVTTLNLQPVMRWETDLV